MKTLFIVATHGDEGFSIPVLKKIEQKFDKKKYSYNWIVGNPLALEKKIRFVDVDLNRNAPGSAHSKYYEQKRASEIMQIAQGYDVVIDILGAKSNCGICTIISLPSFNNLLLASQMNCQNNVLWYSSNSKKSGPLNQHIGKPAIELECGPKSDKKIQQQLYKLLTNYLKRKEKIIFSEGLHWYAVAEKLNKVNFPKNIRDFIETKNKVIPFLSENTYLDGSFYNVKKIKFSTLATQDIN